jgi:hypothetical protein
LGKVAKANNDESCNDFSDGWIDVEIFYQYLQADIVDENTNYYQQEITEQLYPSVEVGIMENNVAHEEESGRETNGKRHDESHDIGADYQWSPNKVLFMQNEIVADEINKNVKQCIATTAGQITESLYGYKLAKRRIKKIDKCGNVILQTILFLRSEYKAFGK